MAKVNIDVGSGSLLVYKGQDFDFPFTIEPPVEDSQDIITAKDPMKYNRDIVSVKQYNMTHYKENWIKLDSFKYVIDDTLGKTIETTGITKARFKYKVEFINIDGSVLALLKDYQPTYIMIYEPLHDEVTVPINLLTTAVNSYRIRVTVLFESGQTSSASREVVLFDEAPTIIATVEKNTLYLTVGDNDNDMVRFNVFLNGRKVYPEDTDYTPFAPPNSYVIKFDSQDIIIDDVNNVIINAQDSYGTRNDFQYQFIGEYSGLLFADEKGQYYSTDLGDILRRLNFGTIMAGSASSIRKVIVINNMGFKVKDLTITIPIEKKPDKLDIYYGFENGIMINSNTMPLSKEDVMENKDRQDLYLQIHPDIEFEYATARFEIQAEASPVEDSDESENSDV